MTLRQGYNSRVRSRVRVRSSDLYFINTPWRVDLGIRMGQGDRRAGDCGAGDGEEQARVAEEGREKGWVCVVWEAGWRPVRVPGPVPL